MTMTMTNMVEEFEVAGFQCNKKYNSFTGLYEFTLVKNGLRRVHYFKYNPDISPAARDLEQRQFIKNARDSYPKFELDGKITTDKWDLIRNIDEIRYLINDIEQTAKLVNVRKETKTMIPKIKKVHFSGPVTTVIWEDGTKTQVRCENEDFDPEKGLAMAISKKVLGTNKSGSNYYDEFNKWIEPYNDKLDAENKGFQDVLATLTEFANSLNKRKD